MMTNQLKPYRQLKQELEETLESLQREDIDIDEALKLHEKGHEILKQMQSYLDEVTKRIKPPTSK